jgi:hypothetical protein
MANQFRNYLINVLTIPQAQTRACLMDEGIDDFEDLIPYRDDAIHRLVENCRKTYKPPQPAPAAGHAAMEA